jgi:tetratricopeptide (TPR) repeat protein
MLRSADQARNLGRQEEAARLIEDAADLVLGHHDGVGDACGPVICLVRLGLGVLAMDNGDPEAAARHWDHDLIGTEDSHAHQWSLLNLAVATGAQGHYERAVELNRTGLEMAARMGDELALSGGKLNEATFLRQAGRPEDALSAFRAARGDLMGLRNLEWQAACIEDLACVFADLDRFRDAALLFRRAEVVRAPYSDTRHPIQESSISQSLERTHEALGEAYAEVAALAETLDVEETLSIVFDETPGW